jgi:hypothetical protein
MTIEVLVTNGQPNWQAFARAYRDAGPEERDILFASMCEWWAADKDLPDDADITSGVIEFLRHQGVWTD